MTVEEIAKKIENPEACSSTDVQELEQLIDKYPYAQSFPILLLQMLGKTKSINFEESLNQHAFRISDRDHLYQLINANETETTIEEQIPIMADEAEPVIEPIELEEKSEDIDKENDVEEIVTKIETRNESAEEESISVDIETPSFEREGMELTKDNSNFDTFEVQEMSFEPVQVHFDDDAIHPIDFDEIPETIVPVEITEEKNEVISEEIYENEPAVIEDKVEDALEEDVIENETEVIIETADSEDLTEATTEEIEKEIQPLSSFDPTMELLDESEVQPTEAMEIEPSEFDKEISLEIIEKSDNRIEDELTSQAITEGFDLTLEEEEKTTVEDKIKTEDITPENVGDTSEVVSDFEQKLADDKRSFLDWLKVSATTHSQEYQVKQRTTEILDKFIEDDPKITRISKHDEPEKKAAEFFKVSKIAKASLNAKEIPVSETLAEIFEAQGNISKAIDCYKQLLLLNPEKKSFFANRIKKLKKKINK